MKKILVSGLINLETTVRIDSFPLPYFPVRYPFDGVRSTVSGVGFNVTLALRTLGDDARLLSFLGQDAVGALVQTEMQRQSIPLEGLETKGLRATPQSVILYDGDGRRQIHVDLKNVQDLRYPEDAAGRFLDDCDLAVLCNVGFSRSLFGPVQARGIRIATDVHALADPDDAYNREFMRAADILFLSNEHFLDQEEAMLAAILERFRPTIVVCGLGAAGALMVTTETGQPPVFHREPAVATRPIVSTIGAGDALFSAFLHFLVAGHLPRTCLHLACRFASWKIGTAGAAEGFLDEAALLATAL